MYLLLTSSHVDSTVRVCVEITSNIPQGVNWNKSMGGGGGCCFNNLKPIKYNWVEQSLAVTLFNRIPDYFATEFA